MRCHRATPSLFAASRKFAQTAWLRTGIWAVALALAPGAGAALRPDNLRCDYQANPLALQSANPRLSWTLKSSSGSERGLRQDAFQILAASRPEWLSPGKADLWDSARTPSAETAQVRYAGKPLRASQQVWWTVRCWDQKRRVSEWARPAAWTVGLTEGDWNARWIQAPESAHPPGALPLFRREFNLARPVRRALVYVCGLGSYELLLNGQRVGDAELDPGWTDYRQRCLYSAYDITGSLRPGTNALGVMLGNGMYNVTGGRYAKFTGSFGPPTLALQLRLEFADGTAAELGTDHTWETSAGPITFSCIYGGEDYDARLEQPGWAEPGFAAEGWRPALPAAGPGGQRVAQSAPPVKVMRTFQPVAVTEPRPGIFVYDLGQNFAGRPALSVRGPAGATVKLLPGELLTPDGLVDQSASGRPVWFAYTLRGGGLERWHPRFSYYGFRYVQVEGAAPDDHRPPNPSLPVVLRLEGQFIHSSAAKTGQFECSNTLVNRIHALILAAIDSNLQSVLTDCPHREKLGWLEVSHLLGRAIMFNYDVAALYRKICADMADAQLESGLVPSIAPEYTVFQGGFRDSPEWGSACILNPWLLFEFYGDATTLEESYETMRRYAGYLGSRSNQRLLAHGLGDWCDVGPAAPGESQLTTKGLTATAIYHEDLVILARVAARLGRPAEAEAWRALAAEVRQAFNTRFFPAGESQYDRGSQTANAMPLVLGLTPAARTNAVLERLAAAVRANQNRVTAGDVGFRFLVEALRAGGRSDVVFDLVTQRSGPGYARQLEKGATALAETWDAGRQSRNHCMLGHAEEWFYTGLAGINPDAAGPGFRRFVLAPQPVGDLTWVKARYASMSGDLESSWKIEAGRFQLEATIPPNTAATIWIPAGRVDAVREGSGPAAKAPGVVWLKSTGAASAFAVGAGHYSFSAPWSAGVSP